MLEVTHYTRTKTPPMPGSGAVVPLCPGLKTKGCTDMSPDTKTLVIYWLAKGGPVLATFLGSMIWLFYTRPR